MWTTTRAQLSTLQHQTPYRANTYVALPANRASVIIGGGACMQGGPWIRIIWTKEFISLKIQQEADPRLRILFPGLNRYVFALSMTMKVAREQSATPTMSYKRSSTKARWVASHLGLSCQRFDLLKGGRQCRDGLRLLWVFNLYSSYELTNTWTKTRMKTLS